jgi:GxxExxY protein
MRAWSSNRATVLHVTLLHRDLTKAIIVSFHETYDDLGWGYHEQLCSRALELDLRSRGLLVRREVALPVMFRGRAIGFQRLDMVVADAIIVELKAVERIHPASERQLRSYLRGTSLEVGLLLNFGPKPEFRRLVLTNDRKPRMAGLDDLGHGRDGHGTGTARFDRPITPAAAPAATSDRR